MTVIPFCCFPQEMRKDLPCNPRKSIAYSYAGMTRIRFYGSDLSLRADHGDTPIRLAVNILPEESFATMLRLFFKKKIALFDKSISTGYIAESVSDVTIV